MSSFWSGFVVVIVLINVIGALWLLLWTSRGSSEGQETGQVWDGDLREYNNPLPRWWLGLFLLTVAYSIGYLVVYPGMGNFKGTAGWTQIGQYEHEVNVAGKQYEEIFRRFADTDLEVLATEPDALSAGRNLFANNCATCHGSDGRGAPGFPSLADNDWLYGGEPETIKTSILDGRNGLMPPLGAALGDQGVDEVVAYVQSLSGVDVDAQLAAAGQARFALCAACHGQDGMGNPALGAPNLTDDIWLYGGDAESIKRSIVDGRSNRMPAHRDILGEEKSHVVAAYVLSLGGDNDEKRTH